MAFQGITSSSITSTNRNPVLREESSGSGETGPLPSTTNVSFIPLEDCKCPICLDYFIDVVETRCHHRFCNFCLENWLRVSVHRQCPTCRSTIQGSILVKPELQEVINSSIRSVLSDDIVRERLQIRLDRQAQVERFSADREQTQALLARITSSRPRARQIRRSRRFAAETDGTREPGTPFISQHIMHWWDDNNNPPPSVNQEVTRRMEPDRFQRDTDIEDLPLAWFRRLRGLGEYDDNVDSVPAADVINQVPQPHWSTSGVVRNNQRGRGHRRAPSHFDQTYHENLMEEYSYHLRRVNSAHTRIREAYRDFNYHNGRMQEVLQEHRSFFSSTSVPTDNVPSGNDENNTVSYEDYEDLIGAEMGELLDNSPAAQVVFGRYAAENAPAPSDLSHNFHREFRSFPVFSHGVDNNNNYTSRNARGNSRRYPPGSTSLSHRSNVLDMDHEIRNRRNQLNHLSSLFRQCPWNSDSRYSRGEFSNLTHTSDRIVNSSAPLSTPMEFVQQAETEVMGRNDQLRHSSGQHQILVERLTGLNGSVPPPPSRRMRRRIARTNIFRPSDRVRTGDEISSNQLQPAQNSYSENTLLPAIINLAEVDIPNVETGALSDITLSNVMHNITPTNTQSPQSQEGTNANQVSDFEPDYHSLVPPSSVGWIANESSESDEAEQTRESPRRFTRTINRSPQSLPPRATSVPPRRTFRRALRFHRRRLDVFNSDTTEGSTATAPETSSSNTNLSILAQNADLTNRISTAATNSDDVDVDGTVTISDSPVVDNFVEDTTNQMPEESFHNNAGDNDSDSMSSAMRNITSMNDYLRTLCDKFKTR